MNFISLNMILIIFCLYISIIQANKCSCLLGYNDDILENICQEYRFSYYTGTKNAAWTTKSWNLGCKQFKLGFKTLPLCKTQCSCNKSPSSFSSHPKYKICSKTSASENYISCRQNACSGGNCCSRSTSICKNACKAFYTTKFSDKIINVTNKNIEKINWINKTRWLNKTRYMDSIRWDNKTRWTDKTRWENKTRWTDKVHWDNKTRWTDDEYKFSATGTSEHSPTPLRSSKCPQDFWAPIGIREAFFIGILFIVVCLFIWRECKRCFHKQHRYTTRRIPYNERQLEMMAVVARPIVKATKVVDDFI